MKKNIDLLRFELVDKKSERIVFSSFNTNDEDLIAKYKNQKEKTTPHRFRYSESETENYYVRAVSDSQDLLASKRIFDSTVSALCCLVNLLVSKIAENRNEKDIEVKRLLHNLSTYNGLSIQEIELLVPQSEFPKKSWADRQKIMKTAISQNIDESAQAVLRLAKFNQGIKAEISVFNKLFHPNPNLKISDHEVHKVIMNSLYIFFPDFTDKNIYVNLLPSNLTGRFDYESFQVALYHMLLNASKYALKDSEITIQISDFGANIKISFDMISLRINDSELRKIFEENYSGDYAKKSGNAGSGLGMFLIKQLLELNGGSIEIKPGRTNSKFIDGLAFDANTFSIFIPIGRR